MQITGIIGAMDVEVAILRSMMKNARTETVSGIDFIIGSRIQPTRQATRCRDSLALFKEFPCNLMND